MYRLASDLHIQRYHSAPRIFMIEYYKKDDRVVGDVFVVSGQDKVFRKGIEDWKAGGYMAV